MKDAQRPPQAGDPINFFNNNDPADSNPFPTVIDSVNVDGSINCTVERGGQPVEEESVNAPDPVVSYYRYWEPRTELEL